MRREMIGAPVPRGLIEALVEAGLKTPMGHNLFQGYRVVSGGNSALSNVPLHYVTAFVKKVS